MKYTLILLLFSVEICFSQGIKLDIGVNFSNGYSSTNYINYKSNTGDKILSRYSEYGIISNIKFKDYISLQSGFFLNNSNINFAFVDSSNSYGNENFLLKQKYIKVPIRFLYSFFNNSRFEAKIGIGLDLLYNTTDLNSYFNIFNQINRDNYTLEYEIRRLDVLNISLSMPIIIELNYHISKKLNFFISPNLSIGLTKGASFSFLYKYQSKEPVIEKSSGYALSNFLNDNIGLSLGIKYSILPIEKNKEKKNNKSKRNIN